MLEPELLPHEREALDAWVTADVPESFADTVVDRLASPRRAPAARPREVLGWWIGVSAAAAAILLVLALPRAAVGPSGAAAPTLTELEPLRAAAHELLRQDCTPCHLGGHAHAQPDALAVFDLDEPDWHARLSDRQLALATARMAERAGGPRLASFQSFVDAELAHRAAR